MSLPGLSRSIVLPFQVLISGKLEDAMKEGEAPRGTPTIQLFEIDPVTQAIQETALKGGVRSDGTFSFFGAPETSFPQLNERTYQLRLEVSAPYYQPASLDFNLGPIAGQPELVARSVSLEGVSDMQVQLFANGGALPPGDPPVEVSGLPLTDIVLILEREPVRLQGQTIRLDDLSQGVDSATLRLVATDETTIADVQGYFEFLNPMPLEETLQIEVSATGFETKILDSYELDYTQPINSLRVALKPDA